MTIQAWAYDYELLLEFVESARELLGIIVATSYSVICKDHTISIMIKSLHIIMLYTSGANMHTGILVYEVADQ